jgi:hypothetical protein
MGQRRKISLFNGRTPPPYTNLDAGIKGAVRILFENGIETAESCQGGKGHAYPEPTIYFDGTYEDGFKALAVALQHNLKVWQLSRVYTMDGGEPTGPEWKITFLE